MSDRNENKDFTSDEDVNMDNIAEETSSPDNDNMSEIDKNQEIDLQEKYDELNNSYLRLHAEYDNYRKRTLKEKGELIKTANERILVDMLPVLDDFERALENMEVTSDLDSMRKGVELIYNKFVDFLLRNGVKKMDVLGKPFDVDKHEALTTIPADDEIKKDKIVDVVQHGYELGDKVIRFPKVIVAK